MAIIQKISVRVKGEDPKAHHFSTQIKDFLGIEVPKLGLIKNFYLQGVTEEQAKQIAEKILVCPITEEYVLNSTYFSEFATAIEVGFQPGVMNPEAVTIENELKHEEISGFEAIAITNAFCFKEEIDKTMLNEIKNRILMNTQIQMEFDGSPADLLVHLETKKVDIIPLREMNDAQLMELSDYKLFLTLEEMQTIQNYYKNLGRDAFDVELETLAQTWSEHCCHKTFKAKVIYNGEEKNSLFSMVKDSEKTINHPDIISKFADNSGVFRFTEADGEEYGICIKAETHNSPSGLDPYGGAMTGSGGVFRDIAGTGKGAKNISSVDIFCLGDPDMKIEDVLPGCLHPRRILTGVVEGVRDYGNRMGIPTNNGSFHFHKDFGPKPTVLVGADGIVPLKYAKKGQAKKGDVFVSFGGKTGQDGIHGATFSSAEMTGETSKKNSGAVQIGNAVEEKRMFDCLIELRDLELFTALTDCGAGGYSSAVGEMGEETGAIVHLENIPLKYPGLSSFEKWISESQERMVASLEKKDLGIIEKVCRKYNVDFFVLGEATDDKKLKIYDDGELVCDLDMKFLHDGQPLETIVATTKEKKGLKDAEYYEVEIDYNKAVMDIISHKNIASKEPVIRQYDHGVQGTCVDGPLCGKDNDGPTGGAIMKPLQNSDTALILGHGLNPVLNKIDAHKGAMWAFYESMSNVIALGADPDRIFMVENYIWPKPTEENTADLYDCVKAVTDASIFFRTPIISGKDSLSSTYKHGDTVIEVPPVICMSARGVTDDWKKTISPDLKKPGNPLLLIGDYEEAELGGSIFFDRLGSLGTKVASVKMKHAKIIYNLIYKHIQDGDIVSAADVSEGGMITAAIEMAIAGKKGIDIKVASPVMQLFAEVPAAFVVEVNDLDAADDLIDSGFAVQIGTVTAAKNIIVHGHEEELVNLKLEDVEKSWKEPFKKYFK